MVMLLQIFSSNSSKPVSSPQETMARSPFQDKHQVANSTRSIRTDTKYTSKKMASETLGSVAIQMEIATNVQNE